MRLPRGRRRGPERAADARRPRAARPRVPPASELEAKGGVDAAVLLVLFLESPRERGEPGAEDRALVDAVARADVQPTFAGDAAVVALPPLGAHVPDSHA